MPEQEPSLDIRLTKQPERPASSTEDTFVELDDLLANIKSENGIELKGPYRTYNYDQDNFHVGIYEGTDSKYYVVESGKGYSRLAYTDSSGYNAGKYANDLYYRKLTKGVAVGNVKMAS